MTESQLPTTSSQVDEPSAQPKKKRSAGKVVITVVIAFASVLILAIVGAVGWGLFRPLLPGDYVKVNNAVEQTREYNLMPWQTMIDTVARPTDAADAGKLNNRIENTWAQGEENLNLIQVAVDSRAYKKDDEVKAHIDKITESMNSLIDDFKALQAGEYPTVGFAAGECLRNVNAAECADAVAAVDAQKVTDERLLAIYDATVSYEQKQDDASLADLDAALSAFVADIDASSKEIADAQDEATAFLEPHTKG